MNSVELSRTQQTLDRPRSFATMTPRLDSALVGVRPSASRYADSTARGRLLFASCSARSASWLAWRWTNELFINASACKGVVVTPRRGVFTEGSGQSKE